MRINVGIDVDLSGACEYRVVYGQRGGECEMWCLRWALGRREWGIGGVDRRQIGGIGDRVVVATTCMVC